MLMLCISLPGFSQMVEHVVDKGETFASIAQKYGMTEKQLKEANPKYKGVFFVGMSLNIPQKYANASSATPQAQPSPEPRQETTAPKQTEAPMPVAEPQQTSAPKPKNYEGDTDKEGRPDGYGTMYFESVYDGEAFTEKLEGTWKKGVPVKGKSFRYYKDNGKLRMKFEGEFKMKEKGVLRNLMDLKAVGDIAFYYYENNKYFDDRGYYVRYGSYDGKQITKGYCVSSKKKAMTPIKNGEIGYWSTNLNPDARKYLDELFPSVGSAWILDRKPSFSGRNVSNKEDRFIKVNDISWTGSLNNGLLDGQGEGFFTLRSDIETVNYNVKGEFKNGVPVKVTIRRDLHSNDGNAYTRAKDQTSLILTMGELQNNQRSVTVESLTHQNDRYDVSYSRFVDADFKFKEDVAVAEKKKDIPVKKDNPSSKQQAQKISDNVDSNSYDGELDDEDMRILKGVIDSYDRVFPDGKYKGQNIYEVWVKIYIKNAKAILERNDDRAFYSFDRNLREKLMMPMLSQNIGPYSEDNSGWVSLIIKRKTEYIFKKDVYYEDAEQIWRYIIRMKPAGLEEALKFRSLFDAIAMARHMKYSSDYHSVMIKNYDSFWGYRYSNYNERKKECIQAAKELSAKYPSIKPACVKAEKFVTEQFNIIDKQYNKVAPAHYETLAKRVKEYRRTACNNCQIDGYQTKFPSGWVEGWSFLILGEPGESKTAGQIVLKNGKRVDWKYRQWEGGKMEISVSGYINGIYPSVDAMMSDFILKCKQEYCD